MKLLKIHVVVHIALRNDKTLQHCMRREQVELLILFVISTKISGSLCPYGVFPLKIGHKNSNKVELMCVITQSLRKKVVSTPWGANVP